MRRAGQAAPSGEVEGVAGPGTYRLAAAVHAEDQIDLHGGGSIFPNAIQNGIHNSVKPTGAVAPNRPGEGRDGMGVGIIATVHDPGSELVRRLTSIFLLAAGYALVTFVSNRPPPIGHRHRLEHTVVSILQGFCQLWLVSALVFSVVQFLLWLLVRDAARREAHPAQQCKSDCHEAMRRESAGTLILSVLWSVLGCAMLAHCVLAYSGGTWSEFWHYVGAGGVAVGGSGFSEILSCARRCASAGLQKRVRVDDRVELNEEEGALSTRQQRQLEECRVGQQRMEADIKRMALELANSTLQLKAKQVQVDSLEAELKRSAAANAAGKTSRGIWDSMKRGVLVGASPPPPPAVSPSTDGGRSAEDARRHDAMVAAASAAALNRMVAEPLDPVADEALSKGRRTAIRGAFMHAWEAYELHAFGKDELKPLSRKGADVMGVGLTLIDSIDTMLVMGLNTQPTFADSYARARAWVRDRFAAAPANDLSVFESCIRVLGGLLSAYALSGDAVYREKAREFGDALLLALDTPTGLPASVINPGKPERRNFVNPYNGNKNNFGDPTTLAEAGSVQLELQYLSHITGDAKYARKADASRDYILSMALEPVPNPNKPLNPRPLFPVDLHPREGRFLSDRLSTGAGGDSFYELLLKQYLLRPFTASPLEAVFVNVSRAILGKSAATLGGMRYLGPATLSSKEPQKKMEHLSCFAPAVPAV